MRIAFWVLVLLVAAAAFLYAYGCLVLSAPRWRGPVSDHFDGQRFHNVPPMEHRGFRDFLRWRLMNERTPWDAVSPVAPEARPAERVGAGEMRATLIGHSTLLLQMDGMNILTDPIWSERAGPVSWAGPKRHDIPAVRFEELPPIDAVLITHNHYDHMDEPTLRRLVARDHPRIFAGLGNAAFLAARGIPAEDLDWWQETELPGGLTITALPSRHFSSRGLCDRDRTLWVSYAIRGSGGAAFFAGDTGFGPQFAEIASRAGPFRLAVLPIGAFKPRWFMADVHLSPEEAVRAFTILGAPAGMAIHFGAFALGDDAREEPVQELLQALAAAGVAPEHFVIPTAGEAFDAPPLPPPPPEEIP